MSDLIEREAAIDTINCDITVTGRQNAELVAATIGTFADRIKALPSAQFKQNTGHWIPVTNGRGGHECDICHDYAPSYQSGDEHLAKYCPNCGAKME